MIRLLAEFTGENPVLNTKCKYVLNVDKSLVFDYDLVVYVRNFKNESLITTLHYTAIGFLLNWNNIYVDNN